MTEQLQKESKHWLSPKMAEAKLTPQESKELAEFLNRGAQTPVVEAKPNGGAEVSLQDVQQLLVWLQERMASANISDAERRQLNDWLVTLLTKSPALDRQELEQVRLMLSEQLPPSRR
jgi:hypothetical protein